MKKSLALLIILGLTACSTPAEPAPPPPPARPAAPARPAIPACFVEAGDMSDAEMVADQAAYYLTCIEATDTSPTNQIERSRPYLTEAMYQALASSTAQPDRYWNATVNATASTQVTTERLYMDNYDPAATGTITLDRVASATSSAAGTQIVYYTFTLEPQSDHTYRVSDVAVTSRG